jgi:mannose-6-phosphate isomerase-like protein (cupin superfamily)
MHQVSARNLPGGDASRKFEAGKHAPPGASFVLEHNNPGDGPRLHRYRCDETFLVTEGRVLVGAGDGLPFEGGPEDIAIAPPGIPPGFTNLGPVKARLICLRSAPARRAEFRGQARPA